MSKRRLFLADPVPGFIDDAGGIVPWITHGEVKLPGMMGQPSEGIRTFKGLVQWFMSLAGQVDGSAGMMFAETGNCIDV